MALLFIRTLLLYLLTLLAMKIMGKRQLGQLQPFELVIVLIVSDMATLAMQSNSVPFLHSLLPIAIICLLEFLFSLLNLKSERIRNLLCGKPVILMAEGKLIENNMRRLRINLNDIQELCRSQGYFDLSAVDTAIMETNGQLSVMPKTNQRPLQVGDILTAVPKEHPGELLVLDGKINQNCLTHLEKDEAWLRSLLQKKGAAPPESLFLAGLDETGSLYWQEKENKA